MIPALDSRRRPSIRSNPVALSGECCDMRDAGASSNLQSVTRAVRALELIAEAGELGVTELGRRLGVHKATASRLVATLA
ncbi:MAG: helix-turn-helix domain-containing protein, partial [Actinomycetota bacterium]